MLSKACSYIDRQLTELDNFTDAATNRQRARVAAGS
jgi:hypothetical protein